MVTPGLPPKPSASGFGGKRRSKGAAGVFAIGGNEIEAALDDANVSRYARYMRTLAGKTQFIVITHRRGTMEEADVLYGVTMQEQGVSKILTINMNELAKELKIE